jgi:hypothetical protein
MLSRAIKRGDDPFLDIVIRNDDGEEVLIFEGVISFAVEDYDYNLEGEVSKIVRTYPATYFMPGETEWASVDNVDLSANSIRELQEALLERTGFDLEDWEPV